jgi:hypothetical protein
VLRGRSLPEPSSAKLVTLAAPPALST